jgi:hypothetical protein
MSSARVHAIRLYFEDVYPKESMLRLLKAGSGTISRRFFIARPFEPDPVRNFNHVGFPEDPKTLATIMTRYSRENAARHIVEVAANASRLDDPWLELHLSWIRADSVPQTALWHEADEEPGDSATVHFEMALDIDLPDYDGQFRSLLSLRRGFLCRCAAIGEKTRCCRRCWLIIRMARAALELIFASALPTWGPFLWVYSGGKGVHGWLGSPAARAVPLAERKLLVEDFARYKKTPQDIAYKATDALSQQLRETLLAAWEEWGIKDLGVLSSEEACSQLSLAFLPSEKRAPFATFVQRHPSSVERWRGFVKLAGAATARYVALYVGLPLIDTKPLLNRNGALKAPFSVHRSTGRIALPLDTQAFSTFDPEVAPSVDWPPVLLQSAVARAQVTFNQWLNDNKY